MSQRASTEVLAAIPHRPPFLFVDRILDRGADHITTEWEVHEDLECFPGHYPGHPVLPGVLVCEFTFQSAALLFAGDGAETHGPALPMLTRIQDARFKKPVSPGETLRAELTVTERLSNARYVRAHVTSAGATVLRIQFTVAAVSLAPERSA